jgi:hypothetical protein
MSTDARFAELMPFVVKVYKRGSIDQYGRPGFASTPVEYNARLMEAENLSRTVEGDDVVIAGKVIIFGIADVTTEDKIELPDGSQPVIVDVDFTDDPIMKMDHTSIKVGR